MSTSCNQNYYSVTNKVESLIQYFSGKLASVNGEKRSLDPGLIRVLKCWKCAQGRDTSNSESFWFDNYHKKIDESWGKRKDETTRIAKQVLQSFGNCSLPNVDSSRANAEHEMQRH